MLTALLAVWFLASVSGVGLDMCPEHGSSGHAAAASGTHTSSVDRHHADHDAGHGPAHSHQCTCVGACCAVRTVALARRQAVALPEVPATAASLPRADVRVRVRAAPDLLLPLSIGPPSTAI